MKGKVTIAALQEMKRQGRKIAGVVVYDYQLARIVDRAGVDVVSVGDSVGVNLWGHASELEVTLDHMILVCNGVRKGVERALVSCDFPYGPLQQGTDAALQAARRLMEQGRPDMLKLDAAADFPDAVRAITAAGIPVWAQFGITPHTALRHGGLPADAPSLASRLVAQFVAEARQLEDAGAALLDFTNSGPVAGPAVTGSVAIPVLGGLGGGPWLDGRIRSAFAAIGYLASALDDATERYANVAQIALDATERYVEDVRAARQIRGAKPPAA